MDNNVKPGDHLRLERNMFRSSPNGPSIATRIKRGIQVVLGILGGILAFLIIFPLFLVFFCPIFFGIGAYEHGKRKGWSLLLRVPFIILGIFAGFCADICFIPGVLIVFFCWLVAVICVLIAGLIEIVTGFRFRRNQQAIIRINPAEDNRNRAMARLAER